MYPDDCNPRLRRGDSTLLCIATGRTISDIDDSVEPCRGLAIKRDLAGLAPIEKVYIAYYDSYKCNNSVKQDELQFVHSPGRIRTSV